MDKPIQKKESFYDTFGNSKNLSLCQKKMEKILVI